MIIELENTPFTLKDFYYLERVKENIPKSFYFMLLDTFERELDRNILLK